jgi:hypothetical protein
VSRVSIPGELFGRFFHPKSDFVMPFHPKKCNVLQFSTKGGEFWVALSPKMCGCGVMSAPRMVFLFSFLVQKMWLLSSFPPQSMFFVAEVVFFRVSAKTCPPKPVSCL